MHHEYFRHGSSQRSAATGSAFAEKALKLDESLAEAHLSLAFVKMFADWNWNEAGKEFRRALELGPGSSAVYLNYSIYPMATGWPEEAIMAAKRAVELDPLSPTANQNLGFIFWSARKFDEALAQLEKTLELNPGHACAQLEVGWIMPLRECERAIQWLKKAVLTTRVCVTS